jgi:hypothetical protein
MERGCTEQRKRIGKVNLKRGDNSLEMGYPKVLNPSLSTTRLRGRNCHRAHLRGRVGYREFAGAGYPPDEVSGRRPTGPGTAERLGTDGALAGTYPGADDASSMSSPAEIRLN